jgi:NAD-dependent SIR2 family protein deacetylase
MEPPVNSIIARAAEKLSKCGSLLVAAGAGMGKDSGLPDFRGNEGFWNHYPPYKNKFDFYECANPLFLLMHPHLFWGFYGSRLIMYRNTQPHYGF